MNVCAMCGQPIDPAKPACHVVCPDPDLNHPAYSGYRAWLRLGRPEGSFEKWMEQFA
jgi:hypothetical protein